MDSKQAGTDILGRLVPMKAYEAASVYSEEKATLLRSLLSSVQVKDEELQYAGWGGEEAGKDNMDDLWVFFVFVFFFLTRQYMSSLNVGEMEALNVEPQLPGVVCMCVCIMVVCMCVCMHCCCVVHLGGF